MSRLLKMEYGDETIQKVKVIAKKIDSHVFYVNKVVKLHDRGGSDERILVISNTSITFYKIKRSPSPDRIMYWPYITKLDLQNDTIALNFGSDVFRFRTPDVDIIMSIIYPILGNILSLQEYNNLDLHVPYTEFGERSFGLISRFVACSKKAEAKSINKLYSAILRCAKYKSPVLEIPSECSKLSNIDYILTTVQLAPYIKSLIFPNFLKFDVFSKAFDFFVNSHSLNHILFSQTNLKTFNHFCQNLINSPDFSISGFGFRNTSFKKEHLQNLKELLIKKNFKSVALQNAVDKTALSYFNKEFFKDLPLMMVNLDRSKNIHISKILPLLQNVEYLSVGGCDINISHFFTVLKKANLNKLQMLNISVNKCTSPLPSDITFPPNIKRLDINKITWDQGLICPFFRTIASYDWEEGIGLGFGEQHTTKDDWESLLLSMETMKPTAITSLVWSFNQVDPRFSNFLAKCCKNIEGLTLVGCFVNERKSEIDAFARSIKDLPTLTSLVIAGYEEKFIGTCYKPILDAIKEVGILKLLDISSNRIGNKGVLEIANLLKETPSLSVISIDGSCMTSMEPFVKCLDAVVERLTPTYICYPEVDVAHIIKTETIPMDYIQTTIAKILYVAKERVSDGKSFFDQPFNSFYIEPHTRFPHYVSNELRENDESDSGSYGTDDEASSGFFQVLSTDTASQYSKSQEKESSSTFDLWNESSDDCLTPSLKIVKPKPVGANILDHIFDDDETVPKNGKPPTKKYISLNSRLASTNAMSLMQFAESSDSGSNFKSHLSMPNVRAKLSLEAFAESSSESNKHNEDINRLTQSQVITLNNNNSIEQSKLTISPPKKNTKENISNESSSNDIPTPDINTLPQSELMHDSSNIFPQIVSPSGSVDGEEKEVKVNLCAIPRIPLYNSNIPRLSRSTAELLKNIPKRQRHLSATFKVSPEKRITLGDYADSSTESKHSLLFDIFDSENKSNENSPRSERSLQQEFDTLSTRSNPQLFPHPRKNALHIGNQKRWSTSRAEIIPDNSSFSSWYRQIKNKNIYRRSYGYLNGVYSELGDSSALIGNIKKDFDSDQKWSDEVYVSSEKDSEFAVRRDDNATIASYDETSGEEQLITERAYKDLKKEHPGIFSRLAFPRMPNGSTSNDDLMNPDYSSYNRSIEESALSSSLYFNIFTKNKMSDAKNPWISELQSESEEEEEEGYNDDKKVAKHKRFFSEGGVIEYVEEDEDENYTEFEEEEEESEGSGDKDMRVIIVDKIDKKESKGDDNEDSVALHSLLIAKCVNKLDTSINTEEEDAPSSNPKDEKPSDHTLGRVQELDSVTDIDSDLSTISQTIDSESITIDPDDTLPISHHHHHHHHRHKSLYDKPSTSQSFIKSLPDKFSLTDNETKAMPKSLSDANKSLPSLKESDAESSARGEKHHHHHHNFERTYKEPEWVFSLQKVNTPHSKKRFSELNQKFSFEFLITNIKK